MQELELGLEHRFPFRSMSHEAPDFVSNSPQIHRVDHAHLTDNESKNRAVPARRLRMGGQCALRKIFECPRACRNYCKAA
jgi:hypothetical protein